MALHDFSKLYSGAFHDFHQGWTVAISGSLNQGLLNPHYYSQIEMPPATDDADVFALALGSDRVDENGCVAGEISEEDERQVYWAKKNVIGIHRTKDDSLVGKIEILEPGDKSNIASYQRFIEKAQSTLAGGINLLIVDILAHSEFKPGDWHWRILSLRSTERPAGIEGDGIAVAYSASDPTRAELDELCFGQPIPSPTFLLDAEEAVAVPLDDTYSASLRGFPRHLRRQLETTEKR